MAPEQKTVEDFMQDAGVAATLELVLETAKQVGISTNQQLIPLIEEGIDVAGRERKDTLLKCEDVIREQIEEVFGKKLVNKLKDEKFCGSGLETLPSSYTGVFLYYLCKGLYEDFGIWFKGVPVSLKPRWGADKTAKTYKTGGRVISTKEAKILMQKADMKYYSADIMSGKISIDDASKAVADAFKEIQKYREMGITLPEKATDKVRYFIEEEEARMDKSVPDTRFNIFKEHNLEIAVPRLNEDYQTKCTAHKKYATSIKNVAGQVYYPDINNTADDNGEVNSADIFKKFPRLIELAKEEVGVIEKDFKVINTHICKQRGKGRMRVIVFDCESSKKGQILLSTDGGDMVSIFEK